MAFFDWSDELSVNIKEIDEQHKQLVTMMNILYDSMQAGEGNVVLGEILEGLVNYAVTHFATEEQYMTKYHFPQYAKHKAEHTAFATKIDELLQQYKVNPTALSIETGRFLKEWWRNHIMGTDQLYGPFLNDNGVY